MADASFDPAPRRSRFGLFALLVTLAFAIGLALMWLAIRDGEGWWNDAPRASRAQPGAPADDGTPAAPFAAAVAPFDPVTLATRANALAAQIAALEARTAAIGADIAGAADQAGRAEAILIAAAARRAIDRGLSLGYLEEQLRDRFGGAQPRAVAIVAAAGRDPVTLEALRQALDANAPLLQSHGADGWFDGLIHELRTLVVLHEANTPSPLPADRLARARRMLDAGQVEPAIAEVERLPGAAGAQNWLAAARRYVDARKALDVLEQAAIVGTVPRAAVRIAPPAEALPEPFAQDVPPAAP